MIFKKMCITMTYIKTINVDQNNIVHDLDFSYDSSLLMTCGEDAKGKFWKTTDWSAANPS